MHRKSVKKGFAFTLMVAGEIIRCYMSQTAQSKKNVFDVQWNFLLIRPGESGLGKSTLVNSLFLTDLYKDRKMLNAEGRISLTKTKTIKKITQTFTEIKYLFQLVFNATSRNTKINKQNKLKNCVEILKKSKRKHNY